MDSSWTHHVWNALFLCPEASALCSAVSRAVARLLAWCADVSFGVPSSEL